MKALYDIAAPAKINLFLHITGRRADGYHLLQSAFMLIDWHDTLHFERRADGAISREDLGKKLPADDLVVRAARALQAATATSQGVHIAIDKRLPVQAGLGGGSSDAASCLLALNRLWKLDLSQKQLERIGLTLGADVPFFLRGRNAWVEGIGEQITPLALPAMRLAVVKPPQGLETRLIFSDPRLERETPAAIISGFAAHHLKAMQAGAKDWFGRNDLQAVAQLLCPGIVQALGWLDSQGLTGRMTGSGSAVFAGLAEGADLLPAPDGWEVKECRSLEVHPLVGWAPSDGLSVGG